MTVADNCRFLRFRLAKKPKINEIQEKVRSLFWLVAA